MNDLIEAKPGSLWICADRRTWFKVQDTGTKSQLVDLVSGEVADAARIRGPVKHINWYVFCMRG